MTMTSMGFGQVKELVGGTLIYGFGDTPIQNKRQLIEDERILEDDRQGNAEIPPMLPRCLKFVTSDKYQVITYPSIFTHLTTK